MDIFVIHCEKCHDEIINSFHVLMANDLHYKNGVGYGALCYRCALDFLNFMKLKGGPRALRKITEEN